MTVLPDLAFLALSIAFFAAAAASSMAAAGFDGEPMTLESLAGVVISAVLMVYLVHAMLRPEDF